MARNPIDREYIRIRLLLLMMSLALGFISLMLWRIQVRDGHEYQRDELRQSVRRVRIPGMRGRIFDAQGEVLADNRPSFNIVIFLEEVRQPGTWTRTINHLEELLDELTETLGVERELTREAIQSHIRRRLPMPLVAWRDVDETTLARWAEQVAGRPGIDIYTEAMRVYPRGALASHLLGYVGRADLVHDDIEPFHYYVPEMEGRAGLERRFDAEMRAAAGARLVRVDAVGYRHGDMAVRDAGAGQDIRLTIDHRVQAAVESALGEEPSAAVVLDPRSGDILALASAPAFNPNNFVPAISAAEWRALMGDAGNPMLNRAVAGAYAPGSIFKPIVAVAALEGGHAAGHTVHDCQGIFHLGRASFRCWARQGHGPLNVRQSIEQSCNVYYFRQALQMGYDVIYDMASAMGLGRRTGITLDHEVSGILPNDAWKRRVFNDAWRDGDTVNLSIGQGPITVTPLQMAVVAAALANGGTVFQPRLVNGIRPFGDGSFTSIPPEPAHIMSWGDETLSNVRGGMRDAVMGQRGTARLGRVPGLTYASKTGTAQYGPRDEGRTHAWTIAFAPYDQPRYALVVLVEDGVSGGQTASPMVGQILQALFPEEGSQ